MQLSPSTTSAYTQPPPPPPPLPRSTSTLRSKYHLLPKALLAQVVSSSISRAEKRVVLEELYREQLRQQSPHDLASFMGYVLKDEKKMDGLTQRPAHVIPQPFHHEWCQALMRYKRLCVWSPRYTGKTQVFSILYPLWLMGRNPNMLISIVSKSSGQSKKPLAAIRQYIERDPDLQNIFPNLKPAMSLANPGKRERWAIQEIVIERSSIAKDSTVMSYGLGTKTLRGARANLIVFDDVLAFDGRTITDGEIEDGIAFFEDLAKFCVTDDDWIVVNGTPARDGDLLHHLESKEDWMTLKYSFEKSDEDMGYRHIEWPAMHPQSTLDREKRQNLIAYNRNRRCVVSSPDEQLFGGNMDTVVKQDYDGLALRNWPTYVGMDLSTAKRKGTALCTVAVHPSNQLKVVVDVDVGNWEPLEKAQKIREYGDVYRPEVIKVENNALQDDVMKLLIAAGNRDLPIEPYTTGRAKQGALETMALEVKNGLWRFNLPDCSQELIMSHQNLCECRWCRFVSEVKGYPNYMSTDMLMAWMFAAEAAREAMGNDIGVQVIDLSSGRDVSHTMSNKGKSQANDAFNSHQPLDENKGFGSGIDNVYGSYSGAGELDDDEIKMLRNAKPLFGFSDYYFGNQITKGRYLKLNPHTIKEATKILTFIQTTMQYQDFLVGYDGTNGTNRMVDMNKLQTQLATVPDDLDKALATYIFEDMVYFSMMMNGHSHDNMKTSLIPLPVSTKAS